MATFKAPGRNTELNSPLFADCEHAYQLIQSGDEKEAEKQFPLEYYLIKKYLYGDVKISFLI